jgi:hypothetical protein
VLSFEVAIREIIDALLVLPSPTHEDANKIKLEVSAKYHLNFVPNNSDILSALNPSEKRKLLAVLRRKNTRVISGLICVLNLNPALTAPEDPKLEAHKVIPGTNQQPCVDPKTATILISR